MEPGYRTLVVNRVRHRVRVPDDARAYTHAELMVFYKGGIAAPGLEAETDAKDGCGNPAFRFQPGDVVELNSGGLQMTVVSVTKDFMAAPIASLMHSHYNSIDKVEIPEICLRLAQPKDKSLRDLVDGIPF